MGKLIDLLEQRYYADLIKTILEIIAISCGVIYLRRDRARMIFVAYLVIDLFVLVVDDYLQLSPNFTKGTYPFFNNLSNTLVAYVELIAYYFFFSKVLTNHLILKAIKILTLIFSAVIIIYLFTRFEFWTSRHYYVSYVIGALEFLFILLPCLSYYHDLFDSNFEIDLFSRPSFWIVTGIFFYSVISVPYYLISHILLVNDHDQKQLFELLLYDLPFAINFIFLTRAFLCKKILTT